MADLSRFGDVQVVTSARDRILQRFSSGKKDGIDTSLALSRTMDEYFERCLHPLVRPDCGWAVVAVGSYGRRELTFSSDVDCILLHRQGEPRKAVSVLEQSVLELWNAGIHASVAIYRIDRADRLARKDDRVLATLLDRRSLLGDAMVLEELSSRLNRVSMTRVRRFARFLEEEGDGRTHDRHLDLFGAEPDIKLGHGGLRDLATIGWLLALARPLLTRRVSGTTRRLSRAVDHTGIRSAQLVDARRILLSARHYLGGIRGLRRECLTREAAARRNFGPALYRSRVEVACIRDGLLNAVAADSPRRFRGLSEGFGISRGMMCEFDPISSGFTETELLRRLTVSLDLGLVLTPAMACDFRISEESRQKGSVLDLLDRPGVGEAIEWLHRYGLLSRFVPGFVQVEGLVPGDEIHEFTVDRHSVLVVKALSELLDHSASLPPGTEGRLDPGSLQRAPLLLAALLHDIGRASGPPHEVTGSRKAMTSCLHMGLDRVQADLVRVLCLDHMVLPEASVGLDCEDPSVQTQFADSLESTQRLDMLLVLAIADMRSLGPGVETGFREELLVRAWRSIRERMEGQAGLEATRTSAEKRREVLTSRVARQARPDTWLQSIVRELPTRFLTAFDESTLWKHLLMLEEARKSGPLSLIRRHSTRNVYDLTYVGSDDTGILSRITGRLTLEGLSIQEARIFSLPGRLVLDSFRLLDTSGRILASQRQKERVSRLVVDTTEETEINRIVTTRMGSTLKALGGEIVADVDNGASESATLFRITGPDSPGLLHMVAHILFLFGIEVTGAIVTTEAGRVHDTFFTELRSGGGKVTDPEIIRNVLRTVSGLGNPVT